MITARLIGASKPTKLTYQQTNNNPNIMALFLPIIHAKVSTTIKDNMDKLLPDATTTCTNPVLIKISYQLLLINSFSPSTIPANNPAISPGNFDLIKTIKLYLSKNLYIKITTKIPIPNNTFFCHSFFMVCIQKTFETVFLET